MQESSLELQAAIGLPAMFIFVRDVPRRICASIWAEKNMFCDFGFKDASFVGMQGNGKKEYLHILQAPCICEIKQSVSKLQIQI